MKFTAEGHEYEIYFDLSTLESHTGQFNEYLVDLNIFQDDLRKASEKDGSLIVKDGSSYYMVPPLAIDKNEKAPEFDTFDSDFYSYVPKDYIVLLPGCCGGSKHMKDDQKVAFRAADRSKDALILKVSELKVGKVYEVRVLDRDPWDHPLPCDTSFNFVTYKLKYMGKNQFQVWRHNKTSPPDTYHTLLGGNCYSVGHMTYFSNDSWKNNSERIGYGASNKSGRPVPVSSYFFIPKAADKLASKTVRRPPHLNELQSFITNFEHSGTLVLPLKGHTLDPKTAVTAKIDAGLSAFASLTNPVALITGNGLVRTADKKWSNQCEVDFYTKIARKDIDTFKLPLLDTVQTYEREVNDYFSGDVSKETATYMPCFALTGFNAGTTTSFFRVNRTILVVPDFLTIPDKEKAIIENFSAEEFLASGLAFSKLATYDIVCGIESASATVSYSTKDLKLSDRAREICKAIENRISRLTSFATKSTATQMRMLFSSFFLQIFSSQLYTEAAFGCCKYCVFDSVLVKDTLKADFLKNKWKYAYKVDGEYVEKGSAPRLEVLPIASGIQPVIHNEHLFNKFTGGVK